MALGRCMPFFLRSSVEDANVASRRVGQHSRMGGSATAPGISNKSRTGSTKGSFKRNGEVLGYAHFTPPARPAASREVMTSTAKASYKDPNEKQPIVKYDPNALRNRLPVVFEGAAKPFARFCQVRNNHTYDFMNPGNGAKPPGFNPYRTTSQNFFAYDTQMLAVGESNQGIVSEKARNLHRQILQ